MQTNGKICYFCIIFESIGVFYLKTAQVQKPSAASRINPIVLKSVLLSLISFFVSNAQVMGSLSPFGIALTAAVPMKMSYVSFVGCCLGYIVFGRLSESLSYLAALVLVLAIKQLLYPYRKLRENALLLTVITTVVSIVSGLIIATAVEETLTATIIHLLEAILAGGMTLFCSLSYKAVFGGKPLAHYDSTESASTVIVGIMTIIALCGVELYGNSLGRILSVIAILVAAYCGGIGGCAVISISAAIAMALYQPELALIGGVYVVAGFLAAVFRPVGRIGQLAIFISSNLFGLFVVKASGNAIYSLLDVLIGTTVFLLIPERALGKLRFPTKATVPVDVSPTQSGISAKLGFASKTLLDLQESIEQVSAKMDELSVHDITTVYDKTAEDVCKHCGLKLFCWETAYDEVMRAFHAAGRNLRTNGKIDMREEMPAYFRQKCCKLDVLTIELNHNYQDFLARENAARRISDVRNVAIEQFDGIADMLCEVSKELAEIQAFDRDAQDKAITVFHRFEESPKELSCMIDQYGRMVLEAYFDKPIRTNLTMITQALSDALKRSFELPSRASVNQEEKLSFFEKANYRLEFFAAQQPAIGGQVCGDCYEYFLDGRGFAHMILSDGMGNGNRAAVDSVMTCNLFLKLIKAGFGFESALKLLNSSLLMKSSDESLATLDIGCVDLYTGQLRLMKAGAAVSFVRQGGQVMRAGASSLPVGILQGVSFDRSELTLCNGDLVVMVSDGVLETGEEWVSAELELYGDKNARELAEHLCKEAGRRRIDGHSDDITVMVSKLKKAE